MRYAIYKFPLEVGEDICLDLKSGAEVLHVGLQRGNIQMWVRQDLDQTTIDRRYFRVYGTGHIGFMSEQAKHIGSVISDGGVFVWHVFEE